MEGVAAQPFRVLITREAEKAVETAREVEARGFVAIVFPTIETALPEDTSSLRDALRDLDASDWVVFPSRTAVASLTRVARELGVNLAGWRRCRFAAVGEGTSAALVAQGVLDVILPDPGHRDAEGLADALIRVGVSGARVLIPRAEQGREVLASRLRAAGAHVTEVTAYRTIPREVPRDEVEALLRGPRPDAALFMSPSAFRAFLAVVGEARDYLRSTLLCAIGRTTAQAMSDAGWPPHATAPEPSVGAALDAITAVARRT